MDSNFQTSFIPKKPLAEERVVAQSSSGTSLYSFAVTILFFASLASAGGMYFYEASLQKSITADNASLSAAQNAFEPSLITTLQTLNRRITDSNLLLSNHIAVSPIFAALEANTLKGIQFTKFSYSTPGDPSAQVTVNMSGLATNYAEIALQSDQLATNSKVHNSIFSNLALDPTTGMVSFDLTFTVDPSLVRFVNNLSELAPAAGATSAPAPSAGASTTVPADATMPASVPASSGAATPSTSGAVPGMPVTPGAQ